MTHREGTIEELCNVEYGTRVVRKRDSGTIYPVYGGGGETFFLDTYNREDRVVIARFAMSEKCTRRVLGKFALNDSGLTLSSRDQAVLRQDFLDYYILSLNDQIYQSARGTAQKNLDVPAFRQMKITYPVSLKKQREIVEKLDKALAEVDLLERNLELSEENANQLLHSILNSNFAKFDQITGLEKPSGIQGIVMKLEGLTSIQTGKIDVNKAVVGGNYPFFTCSREVYAINDAPFQGKAVLVAGNGDLNVKYFEGRFNAYQRTYFLFVNDESELIPKYLYWFLESYVDQLRSESIGSTIKYIKMGNLTNAEIPLPSLEKQGAIVEKLDSTFAEIELLKEQIKMEKVHAGALRQSLLSSAFSQEKAIV